MLEQNGLWFASGQVQTGANARVYTTCFYTSTEEEARQFDDYADATVICEPMSLDCLDTSLITYLQADTMLEVAHLVARRPAHQLPCALPLFRSLLLASRMYWSIRDLLGIGQYEFGGNIGLCM